MKLIFIFLAIVLYLCMIVSGDFAPHIPFGLISSTLAQRSTCFQLELAVTAIGSSLGFLLP